MSHGKQTEPPKGFENALAQWTNWAGEHFPVEPAPALSSDSEARLASITEILGEDRTSEALMQAMRDETLTTLDAQINELERLMAEIIDEALREESADAANNAATGLEGSLSALRSVRDLAAQARTPSEIKMAVASAKSVIEMSMANATAVKQEAGFQLGATATEIFQAKMEAYDAQWAALEQRAAANNAAIDQLAGKYGIDLSPFRNERAALEEKLNQTEDRVDRALIRTDMAQNDVDAAEATVEELRKRGASERDIEDAERRLAEARRVLAETQALAKKEVEEKQQQLQAEQKQIEEAKKKTEEEGKAEIAAAQLKIIDAERNREKVRNDPNSTPEEKAEAEKKVEEAKKESAKKEEGLVQKQEQLKRQKQENDKSQANNERKAQSLNPRAEAAIKSLEEKPAADVDSAEKQTRIMNSYSNAISDTKESAKAKELSVLTVNESPKTQDIIVPLMDISIAKLSTSASTQSNDKVAVTGGEEANVDENKSPNIPQKIASADTNIGRA